LDVSPAPQEAYDGYLGYMCTYKKGEAENMSDENTESQNGSEKHASNFSFMIIALIHDNFLRRWLDDPIKTLKTVGLKPGLKVVEVGCGPGFFTIPAAEIVGSNGLVYAVDVHPRAIERVKQKIESKGIKNVCPMPTNASNIRLPEQSIDLVFMFGLPYIVGGQENVIFEMHRILKPGGILSFKKTRGSDEEIIKGIESGGFIYSNKDQRIFSFVKAKNI
jgi:ubiquinone/menaquinone biosynthesis C-methylase UbiE